MKKLLLLPVLLLLASCSMPTQQEIDDMKVICDINGQSITINENTGSIYCRYKRDKVMDCIREYRYGIDEKYNNPDTVSNLREDEFSNVVETCNKIFGNNLTK